MTSPKASSPACVVLCLIAFALPVSSAAAEQLEMDVITVYGKESYRIQKEVFDLLAPLRKEDLSKMQLKKRFSEPVEKPALPLAAEYETAYPILPSGDVPTIVISRTGILLYPLTKLSAVENVRLEFVGRDGSAQQAYLKSVRKDQYVEMVLPEGFYRMAISAEGIQPAFADSIVVHSGQISLVIVPLDEIRLPSPKVEPPPPPPPEKPVVVRLIPLRKPLKKLPEPKPVMITKGRVTMQEQGLAHMEVRLYEKEVGFFDPYDPTVEDALLAVTVTDSNGSFEFPPIDNDDGFFEGTRDPLIVLSLQNRFLSIQKPFAMSRSVPYRYIIYQKDNVQPDAGNLELGQIAVRLKNEPPIELFKRADPVARELPLPIRIIFPSGSAMKLSSRRLEVPQNADFSAVPQFLSYLRVGTGR